MKHHYTTSISRKLAPTLRALVLGAAVAAALASPSFAQSYDPDLGSGNVRPYGGFRHFGINPAWRASVLHYRGWHGRHHRIRHR